MKKARVDFDRRVLGVIPANYPQTILRGLRVYEEEMWKKIQNTMLNIHLLNEAMKNYHTTHNYFRNLAKEIGKRDDLDICVETAFRLQLEILNPGSGCGIDPVCSHYLHRYKPFTDYLRGETFRNETLQWAKQDNLMVIIPEQLKEILNKNDV